MSEENTPLKESNAVNVQMTKDKLVHTQMSIFQIGRIVSELDLDGFIDNLVKSQKEGAALDRDLFEKAKENMEQTLTLAKSLIPVKAAFKTVFETMVKNAAKSFVKPKPTPPSSEGPDALKS